MTVDTMHTATMDIRHIINNMVGNINRMVFFSRFFFSGFRLVVDMENQFVCLLTFGNTTKEIISKRYVCLHIFYEFRYSFFVRKNIYHHFGEIQVIPQHELIGTYKEFIF